MLKKIHCVIIAKDHWYDHFLANDEPNCEITIFDVDAIGASTIDRVQFGFCHRGWMEEIDDVEGSDLYRRFSGSQVGDVLEIEYLALGKEPATLAYMGGHTTGRGPVLNMDDRPSRGWLSIENTTQDWTIDVRKSG